MRFIYNEALTKDIVKRYYKKYEERELIQKTVEEVYKDVDGEDLSEYAPLVDVASKVENIVTQVQENKQNDTQINVSLGDVKDIINIVNDKQVIVDVINEIQVKDEISDIIVNSTPEEAVDFITNVEMDTIIEVYKNVEISKEEVKDIITNVGTDNLIDIVDKVGIDSIKDLANAMDFTKEELKETITNSVADISVASIIKTIKFISVDGAKVYEEGQFVAAGLGTIVKKLPKLSEIATLSDDKKVEIGLGSAERTYGVTYNESTEVVLPANDENGVSYTYVVKEGTGIAVVDSIAYGKIIVELFIGK